MSIWPKLQILNLINKRQILSQVPAEKDKFPYSVKIFKEYYIIRYYVRPKCCESKMVIYGGLRFLYITYLKNTKFNPVTYYLTATKIV